MSTLSRTSADSIPAPGYTTEVLQEAKESEVIEMFRGFGTQATGAMYSYRHDWGDHHNFRDLNLRWNVITNRTTVFVSIGEGLAGGGKLLGAAKYLLYNVAPENGLVRIRLHIEWGSPLRTLVDYLVVNP